MMPEKKTVLVFGTFDRFHPGHRFFLTEAAKLGDRLVVAVARDAHVQQLKCKTPSQSETERQNQVAALPMVNEVVLSDEELGSYEVLHRVQPALIVLGHDQDGLKQDLLCHLNQIHAQMTLITLPQHGTYSTTTNCRRGPRDHQV